MLSDYLPFLSMVLVQFGYAGMNIISKLAMDSGMKPLVLVAYRQIFATLAIIPFAYFIEWKTRPRITWSILFQIFLCSITGVTGNQVLYFVGLEMSTPTIGCALTNILPAFTFVLAVIFRQESVGIKKRSGQAKVLGTIVCVGGAMLLSFYNGHNIGIPNSNIQWKYAQKMADENASNNKSNLVLGSIVLMASVVSWAVWFIIQANVSNKFPAPYTSTTMFCFMGSIQCGAIALIAHHKTSEWSLHSPIRLISALYSGIICSALAFALTSWSIQKKGPLYVSVFNPCLLVIVSIVSWALLDEKLYVGTVVGSVLIVIGLYGVLWGKGKEAKEGENEMVQRREVKEDKRITALESISSDDLELQMRTCGHSPDCCMLNTKGDK